MLKRHAGVRRIGSVRLPSWFLTQISLIKLSFTCFGFETRNVNNKRINPRPLPPPKFTLDSAHVNLAFDVTFERGVDYTYNASSPSAANLVARDWREWCFFRPCGRKLRRDVFSSEERHFWAVFIFWHDEYNMVMGFTVARAGFRWFCETPFRRSEDLIQGPCIWVKVSCGFSLVPLGCFFLNCDNGTRGCLCTFIGVYIKWVSGTSQFYIWRDRANYFIHMAKYGDRPEASFSFRVRTYIRKNLDRTMWGMYWFWV
jgi:hypothetical protein